MAATDLLIDGYNLLYAAGYGRLSYGAGDLQRARQRLLKTLFQLLTPAEIVQTAVVFDAREPPTGLPKNWYIHGLRVMYAQPHGDADEMLEELIDAHSAPRRLTVVSSDHRLQRAAKRRRAAAIDSDQFLEHLERRHPNPDTTQLPDPPPTSPKATGEATTAEVDYWMRVFGDVKVSDLAEANRRAITNTETALLAPQRSDAPGSAHSPAEATTQQSPSPATRNRKLKETRLGEGRHSKTQPDSGSKAEAMPELFSQAWIDELQSWVDGLQNR